MTMAQDTIVFDTHEAVQQLTSAGVPEQQAEALVQLQARYRATTRRARLERNIVTKPDMELVVARLRKDLGEQIVQAKDALSERIDRNGEQIGQAKDALSDKIDRNFKWLVGTQLGFTAVLIAAIKLV